MKWQSGRGMVLRGIVVLAMSAFTVSAMSLPSVSADRDDLVRKQQEAQRKRDELEIQIAAFDKDLQQHIRTLASLQEQIPVAQQESDAATEASLAAKRELQLVTDQLNVAQAELAALGESINTLDSESDKSDKALASMAREIYRSGDSSSPLVLALSADSTSDISQRASTAQSMARVQARALASAKEKLAVTKNKEARQTALTERISGLRVKAEVASAKADETAAQASAKLAELNTLRDQEAVETEKLKGETARLQAQAKQQDDLRATINAEIAKIDAENRRRAEEAARRAREEAARRAREDAARRNAGSGNQGYVPAPVPAPAPANSGGFIYPLPQYYPVTSGFGPRYIPGLAASAYYHYGIDLGAPCGTPAIATANGTVTTANWHPLAGNWVVMNYGMINGNSIQVMYMHFTRHNVVAGQSVRRGDVVGFVGTTGNSTGCHLHYEVHVNGVAVNPLPYM